MKRWTKRVVLIVVASVLGSAAVLAFRPQKVRVVTSNAARGPLRITVEGTGRARVKTRYVVSAPTTGQLARIALRAGDPVTRGQIVARITPSTPTPLDSRTRLEASARLFAANAARAEALTALERAKLARDQARRELERAKRLVSVQAISAGRFEAAELEAQIREREVNAAIHAGSRAKGEADAARALLRVDPTTPGARSGASAAVEEVPVFAPVRGSVLRILFEHEGPIAAGASLVEIGDLGEIEAVVDLLTTKAARVRPGASVELNNWGGTALLVGVVRRIEPSAFTKVSALGIEEQRVNVVIDPESDPWTGLSDGYYLETKILVVEKRDALKVPSGALFRQKESWSWMAFVVENGRARLRKIEAGDSNGSEVEIRSGLREGERVILHPGEAVADGAPVEPAE